jgi:hypothetical protein
MSSSPYGENIDLLMRQGKFFSSAGDCQFWLPDSIDYSNYTTGLVAWYDASDLSTVTETNSVVDEWQDKSGNGFHLLPELGTTITGQSTVNGLNVLSFDGAANLITLNDILLASADTDTYTIFAVFQSSGSDIQHCLKIGDGTSGGTTIQLRARTTTQVEHCWWTHSYMSDVGTWIHGRPNLATIANEYGDGGIAYTRVNGMENVFDHGNSLSLSNGAKLRVGARNGVSKEFLSGIVAEIKIYDIKLAIEHILGIEASLVDKWNIT